LRELGSFVSELDGTTRVPRSARVDLRGWASEQRSIAEEADSLLFEIREAGADSFPFLLRGLVDDHGLLARRIGPPKYRADTQSGELGARIQRDWERLVNAIRTEAERLRNKIEQPEQPPQDGESPGEGEQPPQQPNPLVSVAAEVQLLKQLQEDLLERMQSLQSRRELLGSAGIELDEDDLAELEAVVDRQKRLRALFESILERLQDTGETGEEI
jgi:ribonuclease D